MKNTLIVIGVIIIVFFIMMAIIGFKVFSTVLVWVVGFIALIALIGIIMYYAGKARKKSTGE